jgi:penicillin-binding protein 2
LPPPTLDERRPPITPQMAVRVAVLGGVAFALFAIIFFRLWFLQVLTGEDYVSQARENRVRKVRVEAPRGDIVDRNRIALVKTREAPVVQIQPSLLPESELQAAARYGAGRAASERRRLAAMQRLREFDARRREAGRRVRRLPRAQRAERARLARAARQAAPVAIPPIPADARFRDFLRRLGHVLGVRPRTIHARVVQGIAAAPYANVTIKTDVDRAAYNYLFERREQFPGVEPTTLYLREYPHDELAAQLFGTLREISPAELKERRYRGVEQGTRIGKDGIEETYDDYLRGIPGYDRIVINALGERDDTRRITRREPRQGNRVRLTLDLGLEEAAHQALKRAISAAAINGAQAGAYVAMNPRNGEVYALGSYPSFDANLFAKPLSQPVFDRLNSEANGAPLFNRAIGAGYPTGSTFKPITALASLESGILGIGEPINDSGSFQLGDRTLRNARGASYGTLTLSTALKVSSDVFFYTLGARANDRGAVIQRWARRLGLGHGTGVDLPGENPGLIPDRRWRDSGYRRYLKCVRRAHVPAGTSQALYACGGIERPWSLGDNVNLAIGQGDLQATPLQMAVAYSTIVNGGSVVRPHLGLAIEDGSGAIVQELRHPARRRVRIDPAYRATVMDGLRRAAMEDGGTSAGVMKGFAGGRLQVYGKTGTVERPGQADQSWYVCFVPHPTRPIVVVVTVEKGGFGAETAAPAARLILSKWFDLGEKDFNGARVAD